MIGMNFLKAPKRPKAPKPFSWDNSTGYSSDVPKPKPAKVPLPFPEATGDTVMGAPTGYSGKYFPDATEIGGSGDLVATLGAKMRQLALQNLRPETWQVDPQQLFESSAGLMRPEYERTQRENIEWANRMGLGSSGAGLARYGQTQDQYNTMMANLANQTAIQAPQLSNQLYSQRLGEAMQVWGLGQGAQQQALNRSAAAHADTGGGFPWDALGSALGGAAGTALGSFGGPPGMIAGGTIGSKLGGMFGNLFSGPQSAAPLSMQMQNSPSYGSLDAFLPLSGKY